MNRKQQKERLKTIKAAVALADERRKRKLKAAADAHQAKLDLEQKARDEQERRANVQKAWDARKSRRKNTPRTSLGDW